MNNEQVWQTVLGELELSLSKANFTTWFKNTYILENNEGEFTIGVPNGFTKEWLKNKYHSEITKALMSATKKRVTKMEYQVCIKKPKVSDSEPSMDEEANSVSIGAVNEKTNQAGPAQAVTVQSPMHESALNPKYTFDTYVVGTNNELARAAAMAVANNPGTTYNPFFIYGGVGLGKTHLIQSIGNDIVNKLKKKVIYVSSETFINDFVSYIQKERGQSGISTFKNKYRGVDVLLIDDIQFMANKAGTQEEFFHTFNTLYDQNKQIVLSSDRPPKAIQGFKDRLISRFEGGMIADVGLPDSETRKAILMTKCQEKQINVPEEVVGYIATNIQNNVRELEGALNKVLAQAELTNKEPNLELAKTALVSIISNPSKKLLTLGKIIEVVADFYGIGVDDIMAKNRKKEVAWPRQIAMFLMRKETSASYPSIGQEVGGRDHTTAIHAYDKVNKELDNNGSFKQELDLIRQKIYMSQYSR